MVSTQLWAWWNDQYSVLGMVDGPYSVMGMVGWSVLSYGHGGMV